jgi:hypothetical protein
MASASAVASAVRVRQGSASDMGGISINTGNAGR